MSGNDLMQFWHDDDATAAVGLYLESVGNPRKFSRVARGLARRKPVIVVKSGASGFGVPPGHAVRASQVPFEVVDSMLRQAGVIRVENVHQLFDVAQVAVEQPLPAGSRIAIVGNSDALGTLAADACVSWGLQVVHGPTAVHPEAGAEEFTAALRAAFADPEVDAVVASWVPRRRPSTRPSPSPSPAPPVRGQDLRDVLPRYPLGVRDPPRGRRGRPRPARRPHRPQLPDPEDAVRALAAVVRYAHWRRKDRGRPVAPEGVDLALARTLVEDALREHPGGTNLSRDARAAVLEAIGVPLLPRAEVDGVEEAVAAAERFGWPVALKTVGEELSGRQDLRGVRLGLSTPDALRDAVGEMRDVFGDGARTLAVQPMAPSGCPAWSAATRTRCSARCCPSGSRAIRWTSWGTSPTASRRSPTWTSPTWSAPSGPRPSCSGTAAPRCWTSTRCRTSSPASRSSPTRCRRSRNSACRRCSSPSGVSVLDAVVRVAAPQGRADPDRRTLPL